MDKIKNLVSGGSKDDSKTASEPSGQLSGEGSHLQASQQAAPTFEATKGTGISSNPAVQHTNTSPESPVSTEATRGTGISSTIDSTYSSATGSNIAPDGQTNPDALAAASTALNSSPSSAPRGLGTTNTVGLGSQTSAFSNNPLVGSTTPETQTAAEPASTAGTFAAAPAPVVSSQDMPQDPPFSTTKAGTTSQAPPATTEYVGGPAPGVSGQSVPEEAPFSIDTAAPASAIGTGAAGTTVGGLAEQSIADRTRDTQGTSAAVEPSYTERSQQLATGTTTTSNTNTATTAGSSIYPGSGSVSETPAGVTGTSSGVTKVSQPFPSDPISTEPLHASAAGASQQGTTDGAVVGSSATTSTPAATEQSLAREPDTTGATTGTADHDHTGLKATAAAAGVGGTGALAVHEHDKHSKASDLAAESEPQTQGRKGSKVGAFFRELDILPKKQESKYHDTTGPGHTAKNEYYGEEADNKATSSNTARDAAAGVGVAGAGAVGAHEYEKHSQVAETAAEPEAGAQGRKGSKVGALLNELDILPKKQESKFHGSTGPGHTAKDEYYGGPGGSAGHAESSDATQAAVVGAGAAGAGAATYGATHHQKDTVGVSDTAQTSGTTGDVAQSSTGKSVAPISTEGHAHEDDDEPDSPTGTGETKKKRGFLSKLLHRDDPNKLHKEPERKSFEASGAEVPKTTHDAYGSHSAATGGKDVRIGVDGVIGEPGQVISGHGGLDAREKHTLSEAEELVKQKGSGHEAEGHKESPIPEAEEIAKHHGSALGAGNVRLQL